MMRNNLDKRFLGTFLGSFRIGIRRFFAALRIRRAFKYDASRYVDFSDQIYTTQEACLARLAFCSHTLERGFCMPDFRLNFGIKNLLELLPLCREYMARFDRNAPQFLAIIKVIYQYRLCHRQNNVKMPKEVATEIEAILAEFPEISSDDIQVNCTAAEYFQDREKAFPEFSASRHSLRNFSAEPVPLEKITASIDLAMNAPSACNRQSARVVVVSDKEKIAEVFSIHNGNRGFGHAVDKLLLVVGYLPGYSGPNERNWLYLDVGIFTLNLTYALHYNKIGAVILNWSMHEKRDAELARILNIPRELTPCVLIAVGNLPEKFKVCSSFRKTGKEITIFR